MIGSITSSGRYVTVSGGYPVNTYVNTSMPNLGVGNIRYNTSINCMEVCTGSGWTQLTPSSATVNLTPDAEQLLDWARNKRDQELARADLAKTNPAVADLLRQISEKEEQIEMISILLKKDTSLNAAA